MEPCNPLQDLTAGNPVPGSRDRPETPVQKTGQGFNVALNGYRGLCTVFVFVYHLGNAGVIPFPHGDVLRDGITYVWSALRYGVEMFFMISGFVILGSLLRHATVGG